MPYGSLMLQIDFNFIEHLLVLQTSEGDRRTISLEPMTVAEFYQRLMSVLHDVSCGVRIWPNPVEIANPIPFERDSLHQSYDPEYVGRFWRLDTVQRVSSPAAQVIPPESAPLLRIELGRAAVPDLADPITTSNRSARLGTASESEWLHETSS